MSGGLTHCIRTGLLAASLLIGGGARLQAEDAVDRLKQWSSVPPGSSGLVFIIEASVSSFELASGKKKTLAQTKWLAGLPFVRQYRLEPGRYEIKLPPPLDWVAIQTKEGSLTYLRLSPLALPQTGRQEQTVGVAVGAWSGPAPEFVGAWLEKAYSSGLKEAYQTNLLKDVDGRVLLVSTDPPWQIPPPPPPR